MTGGGHDVSLKSVVCSFLCVLRRRENSVSPLWEKCLCPFSQLNSNVKEEESSNKTRYPIVFKFRTLLDL